MTREGQLGVDYTPASSPTTTDADDRLSGAVAVVIAFATLMAALAGFLQADASNQAGDRRRDAEQIALQSLASRQSAQAQAQVELETFRRWVEQRTAAGNALLAGLYAGSDPQRAAALERESARWETIAAATLEQSDIDPEGEFGPEQDATFPQRYFAAATEESVKLNALEDAANEEASAIDQRAAAYTAILATIAVSLYLLGLTLAVKGRWLRMGFLSVGVVLLVAGSLWMAVSVLSPPTLTDDRAAELYAQARVASATARETADFEAAEDLYTQAIYLRPTFARAFAERASVIFQASSPQRSGYVSIAPPEALERARADLERARALGLDNPQLYGSLGFYSFAEGVQSGDAGLLNLSIDHTRQAIALDPGEPVYRYNLGVALAAAGRIDEARAAYQEAVARTIFVDDELTDLRQEPFFEEMVLAGALTDLEIVNRFKPELAPHIRLLKEHIVGRVAAQRVDAPAQSPAAFSNLTLTVFPAEVQWQATIENYDPERDQISAQWYHEGIEGLGWAVIPEISQVITPTVGTDGRHYVLAEYLSNVYPAACLAPGRYRAEIFVNGRLGAEGTVDGPPADYEAHVARDLTAAFCRPQDWQRLEARLPGLIDGYMPDDGQRGVLALRYSVPGTLRELPDLASQMEDLTVASFEGYFPAAATYVEDAGTSDSYFMGLSDTSWRWYDYGTGFVRTGAGVTVDGAVVVGLVYGPYDWFETDEPTRILDSMIHVE